MVEAAGSEDHSFQRPRLTLAVGAVVPTTLVSPEAVAVDAGCRCVAALPARWEPPWPSATPATRRLRPASDTDTHRGRRYRPGQSPPGHRPRHRSLSAPATARRTLGVMALGWATPADRGGGAREPRSPRDRTAPPHGTQSGFFLHRVQLDATADRLRSPSTGVIRDEPRDTLEAAGPRIDDRTPQEASVSSTSTGLVLVSQVRVKGRPATDYRVPLASTPRRTGP
ncbi:unnamed protein product [Ixodes persulcatus]